MRLIFIINTPGQAHTWRYVIEGFQARGHCLKILARDYGSTIHLLTDFGFKFTTFKPVGALSWRLLGSFMHLEKCYQLSQGFNPSMFIGFGIDAAITAARYRKPCIVLVDDEHTYMQNRMTSLLANAIITPDTFRKTLGEKHIRIQSFKELAYLHPKYFKPDISIFDELNIPRGEKYIILRFNVFDAVHDIGMRGFPASYQMKLVTELERFARVFIAPEAKLSSELDKYRLTVPFSRIHHVLYYSSLLVCDTGTMTTEAAILGTPVVRVQSIVGHKDPRSFDELGRKYGLIFSYRDPEVGLQKAVNLIQIPGLKEEWARRRQKLLADKIDITQYMMDFIENYPQSYEKAKQNEFSPDSNFDYPIKAK
jgi:uncharacterized protein